MRDADAGPVPAPGPGPPALAYLTPDQVAELLQVHVKSVYRWAKADPSMPMLKLGGTVRFHAERLHRWLRDREQGQGRPRQIRRQMHALPKPAPDQEASRP